MIWVYAICERAAATHLRGAGLAGAALEGVAAGDLVAVVSRHPDQLAVLPVDAAWVHEAVVERLMDAGPVLPARFGTRVTGAAALRSALAPRRSELQAALEAVRGRVELAVRAVRTGTGDATQPASPWRDEDTGPGAGHRYVRHKLGVRARAEADAAPLHAALAAVAVAAARAPARTPAEVLRASYLVDRAAVATFRSVARRLQGERRDLAVLCTGPWPPYSFIDVAVAPAAAPASNGAGR